MIIFLYLIVFSVLYLSKYLKVIKLLASRDKKQIVKLLIFQGYPLILAYKQRHISPESWREAKFAIFYFFVLLLGLLILVQFF